MGLTNCCLLAFLVVQLSFLEAASQKGCIPITLKSTPSRPDSQILRDDSGAVKQVARVKVWDQISQLPCVEWVNFFYYGNIIIAKDGCAATFKVCYKTQVATTPAPLTTVQPGCEKVRLLSRQARPVSKEVDSEVTSMTLLKDLHTKVPCERGVNFGFDNTVVFATAGCRGDFQVCTTGVQALTTLPPAPRCKTYQILRPTRRTVRDGNNQLATITSLSLEREISKWVCRGGRNGNYFFRGSVFVVNRGCKGVFKVCYEADVTTPAPLTTTAPEPVCKKVNVKSTSNLRGRVTVRDRNGNPVDIVHVHVWDQISKIKCVEWLNFFFSGSSITATGGCYATFKVCYQVTEPTTPAPLTTTAPPNPGCDFVQLLSRKNKKAVVRFPDATISSMTLVSQFQSSKVDCIFRRTFGFRANRAVAKRGCRGLFQICFDTAALTTTAAPAPVTCKKIDVRSRGPPRRVEVTDSNGDAVDIVKVHVWDQISKTKCRRGVNYLVGESSITARGGCQATFKVCYRPSPPAALTTESPETCKKFTILKPTRVTVRETISSVVLEREISKHVCRKRVNYVVRGSRFVVTGGCKGVFTVCYTQSPPAQLTTQAPEPICKKVTARFGRVQVRDDNDGPVRIVKVNVWDQISAIKCVRGANYFVSESSIIARKGCKATFKVCFFSVVTTTPAPLTTTAPPVTCKTYVVLKHSRRVVLGSDNQPAEITRVKLLREISKHVCRRRKNYFYRGSVFVVNGGCKGKFRVCFQDNPTTPAPLTTTAPPVQCKRHKVLSPTRKTIVDNNDNPATITDVVLVREISKHVCEINKNVFFRGSRFIVKHGCKGVFKICFTPTQTTPAPLTTTAAPQPKCKKVTVKSKGKKPARVDVTSSNGNKVHIISVSVWDQISKIKCVKWVNYFYSEFFIIAKKGCQATFKVCYVEKTLTTTPAPLTTTDDPLKCRKHTLEGPLKKTIKDENGDPAEITEFTLKRDFTNGGCKQSKTFKVVGSTVVIGAYCKGVFHLCYRRAPPPTTPAPLTTVNPDEKCRKYTIAVPTTRELLDADKNPAVITKMDLLKVVQNGRCTRDVNFLFSGSTLTVRGTCKGVFYVCIVPGAPQQLTTAAPTPSRECQKINLDGTGSKPDIKTISSQSGRQIVIKSIRLLKELSKDVCREWVNFFASGKTVIAKKGCKGKFKVCYKVL